MRLGVFADVHGNLHALDARWTSSGRGARRILCAGDLVGYGPFPNECARRVASLDGLCVAGNHDLMALGRLGDERCRRRRAEDCAGPDGAGRRVRELLAGLPLGPPRRRGRPSRSDRRSCGDVLDEGGRACLEELGAAAPGARVLVLGHTHHPLAVGLRRGCCCARPPGSVALAAASRCAEPGRGRAIAEPRPAGTRIVLDLSERLARFHALDYDVRAVVGRCASAVCRKAPVTFAGRGGSGASGRRNGGSAVCEGPRCAMTVVITGPGQRSDRDAPTSAVGVSPAASGAPRRPRRRSRQPRRRRPAPEPANRAGARARDRPTSMR